MAIYSNPGVQSPSISTLGRISLSQDALLCCQSLPMLHLRGSRFSWPLLCLRLLAICSWKESQLLLPPHPLEAQAIWFSPRVIARLWRDSYVTHEWET